MTPAIVIFDVAKGFRRRYFDAGGTELADQKRDDLLILDSNRFQVGYGEGTLFRIARISAHPSTSAVAFGVYRAMPSSFQLRIGSYYGGALFASPRDQSVGGLLQSLTRLANILGESIETFGPQRWDIGDFHVSCREIGLELPQFRHTGALDTRSIGSDESSFIDLAGMRAEEFITVLQDGLIGGSILPRYANLFFSFDDAMTRSVLARGLANPRTARQIFSAPVLEVPYAPPVRHRSKDLAGKSGDMLLSRPVNQAGLSQPPKPPPTAWGRAEKIVSDLSTIKTDGYVALFASIFVLFAALGIGYDWLVNYRPGSPAAELHVDPSEDEAPPYLDPPSGPDERRKMVDKHEPAAEGLPDRALVPPNRASALLVEIRDKMIEYSKDPTAKDDDRIREIIDDFIFKLNEDVRERSRSDLPN